MILIVPDLNPDVSDFRLYCLYSPTHTVFSDIFFFFFYVNIFDIWPGGFISLALILLRQNYYSATGV